MTLLDHAPSDLPSAVRSHLRTPSQLYIDGALTPSLSGATFDTLDPSTGEVLARVAYAEAEDVDRAVRAARAAHTDGRWADLAPLAKTAVMIKIAELIEANLDELATLESLDNGKPIADARDDVMGAAATFRYYSGAPTRLSGSVVATGPDRHAYVRKEPHGVCGLIMAWNFPLILMSWKLAPALACGNSVVCKPAEQTPLSSVRLGQICSEAGVPDGVVNVLTGDGATGAALVDHPDVDKISFTGSTEVGKTIMARCALSLKRVSLELGGKSPNIVFADADMDEAVKRALFGFVWNTGQFCTAGTRLFLQREIHDDFVERLVAATADLRLGSGLDESTQVGPLVSAEQQARVRGYLEAGVAEGATPVIGGRLVDRPGFYVEPTVFTGVNNNMSIAQEEIFGPVVSVIPFADEEEAVALANETTYGLAAAVWTRDISRGHRIAARIKAGSVWVNGYQEVDLAVPFGGYKQSGIGRELGDSVLELYTEQKSVVVRL